MNYKKIFSNQKTRFAILKFLSFIPDRIMLSIQYYIKLGRWPNLNTPKRYSEKLQVYKMKYRNPLMGKCVDKYEVREYVKDCNLGNLLNECYGVYDDATQINFKNLPNKFVIKTTDGGGGNNVIICKDINSLDIDDSISKLNSWLNVKDINPGREWAYTQIKKSRIIVEKYIESDETLGGLIDYKFFCFNGKCDYLYVIADRVIGRVAGFGIYDRNFNKLEVTRNDENPLQRIIEKPSNFDYMLQCAEKLSEAFPHVRVDMYNVEGKVIFGELTFYNGSGYISFTPDDFDYILGANFQI